MLSILIGLFVGGLIYFGSESDGIWPPFFWGLGTTIALRIFIPIIMGSLFIYLKMDSMAPRPRKKFRFWWNQ